jgi:HPt (histidine-containing phosphotransfer) domain-containing protein
MIIVAMTAHEGEDAIKACMKAGCTAYLKKPVVRDELLRLVSDALGLAVTSADDEGKIYDEMVYIDPDIAPLVPGYLQNRRVDSERIGSLLLQGDLETIRIIGHSMSGSAGGYGFPEIGRIGRKIELAALDNNTEAIDKLNRQLSDYLCNLRYGLRDTA